HREYRQPSAASNKLSCAPGCGRSRRAKTCIASGQPASWSPAGQARLYAAILPHIVLVMAALAICAVTAAQLRDRTGTRAIPPAQPGDGPTADPGLISLTVRETKRLLAAASSTPCSPPTPPTGSNGAAVTSHDPAGSTNVHAWNATMPWSASDWLCRTGASDDRPP
ncbi:MAG: hypothetical protein ACLPKW_29000, partial [Acetobacteraceae bacterium]